MGARDRRDPGQASLSNARAAREEKRTKGRADRNDGKRVRQGSSEAVAGATEQTPVTMDHPAFGFIRV